MSVLQNLVFIKVIKEMTIFLTYINDFLLKILFIFQLMYQDIKIIKSTTHILSRCN
jgi:hypothetical protein